MRRSPPPPARTMPLVDDVGREFGRCALQGGAHGLDDGVDRLAQAFPDFVGVDGDVLGDAGDEIAPLHFHGGVAVLGVGEGGADADLHILGGALADEEVVLALDVGDDGLVHLVAGHADRLAVDDAGQADDGHLGGAAADVDDHVAAGLGDRKPHADGGRHGLLDEVDLARARRLCRLAHGALFHLGDAGGNAHDHARAHQPAAVVHLAG